MNLRKKFVLVSAGGLTEKFIHRQNNKVLKRHMPKKKMYCRFLLEISISIYIFQGDGITKPRQIVVIKSKWLLLPIT